MGDMAMVTRDGTPTSRIAGSLLRAVRAIEAVVDLQKLQGLAPTLAADLAVADHAWLLLSSGQSTLRIASCHGEEAPAPGPAEFRFPPPGPADESLEPRPLTDSELLAWLGESWRGVQGGVFVLVPVATGSERRAFILVHTANSVPGEAILEDLAVFAVSLAAGLRRAELQESLVSVQHLRAVG